MSALSLNVNIASINCNSLSKVSHPTRRSEFIRFLRQCNSDLIALQETYTTPSLSTVIHSQFRAHSSLWTYRCGIVSMNPQLTLTRIPIPEDDRAILAKVSHVSAFFPPFYVL
ncbi:hypothetical protein CLU79DRAFT_698134, partial [Phycomyces nitens]